MVTTLGRRMALDWSASALGELYQHTDGHPFYVRTLASEVVHQLPARQRLIQVSRNQVNAALPQWRRTTAGRIREVFETLEEYYPDERTLLDIALDEPRDFTAATEMYPVETDHLLRLGLISDRDGIVIGALAAFGRQRLPR